MWPPAVGMLPRVAQHDLNLGPYQIPKGMLIGGNIIGLMHNPNYYIKP
jgi:cytochrome P450